LGENPGANLKGVKCAGNKTIKKGAKKMKLKIEIKMDGAAFDGDATYETSRILEEYAKNLIETGRFGRNLIDINGNVVGEAKRIG